MRTYSEALNYSNKNPSELVEFNYTGPNSDKHCVGLLLNGEFEGLFEYYGSGVLLYSDAYNSKTQHSEHKWFTCDESISCHYFRKNNLMHGEYRHFNEDGTDVEHYFCKSGSHVEELDYLIDADRDESFYVTLALCGIDKEYTLK